LSIGGSVKVTKKFSAQDIFLGVESSAYLSMDVSDKSLAKARLTMAQYVRDVVFEELNENILRAVKESGISED